MVQPRCRGSVAHCAHDLNAWDNFYVSARESERSFGIGCMAGELGDSTSWLFDTACRLMEREFALVGFGASRSPKVGSGGAARHEWLGLW